jgi:hypothetical protein
VVKKLKVEKSKDPEVKQEMVDLETKMEELVNYTGDVEEKLGELREHEIKSRDQFFDEFLYKELVDMGKVAEKTTSGAYYPLE